MRVVFEGAPIEVGCHVEVGCRVEVGCHVEVGCRVEVGAPVEVGCRVEVGAPVEVGPPVEHITAAGPKCNFPPSPSSYVPCVLGTVLSAMRRCF